MGNTSSQEPVEIKSLSTQIDDIAVHYILKQNTIDLLRLTDQEYYDNLIVLIGNLFQKRLTDMEIGSLNQRMFPETIQDVVLDLMPQGRTKELMVQNISRFYVKIMMIYSAIVSTIDPQYAYEDESGEKQLFYLKDIHAYKKIPRHAHPVVHQLTNPMNLCRKRISILRNKIDMTDPDFITINPGEKMCSTEPATRLSDEIGIHELDLLYYDVFDPETNSWKSRSPEMEAKYKRDLKTFYMSFTGKTTMPETIRKFKDIELFDFRTLDYCADPLFTHDFVVSKDDDLILRYKEQVELLEQKTAHYRNVLIANLRKLFTITVGETTSYSIRSTLTLQDILVIEKETRNTIIELYTQCEQYFIRALLIFEEIYDHQSKLMNESRMKHLDHQPLYQQDLLAGSLTSENIGRNDSTGDNLENQPYRPQENPAMNPVMSPVMNPEMSPEMSPAMTPEMNPAMTPAMSPEMSPVMNKGMTPVTPMVPVIPMASPTVPPTVAPTVSPQSPIGLPETPAIPANKIPSVDSPLESPTYPIETPKPSSPTEPPVESPSPVTEPPKETVNSSFLSMFTSKKEDVPESPFESPAPVSAPVPMTEQTATPPVTQPINQPLVQPMDTPSPNLESPSPNLVSPSPNQVTPNLVTPEAVEPSPETSPEVVPDQSGPESIPSLLTPSPVSSPELMSQAMNQVTPPAQTTETSPPEASLAKESGPSELDKSIELVTPSPEVPSIETTPEIPSNVSPSNVNPSNVVPSNAPPKQGSVFSLFNTSKNHVLKKNIGSESRMENSKVIPEKAPGNVPVNAPANAPKETIVEKITNLFKKPEGISKA